MMWGNGFTMAWGWPIGLLMLVALIVLAIWAVRTFASGMDNGDQRGDAPPTSANGERSHARRILDDRFARGELNATDYQQRIDVLEDRAQ